MGEMHTYVELNSDMMVKGMLVANKCPNTETFVEVPNGSNIMDYLYKKYENGEWVDVPKPEPKQVPLTDTEEAIFDTQANVEYLACLAELG